MPLVRTTLTIDPDVALRAKQKVQSPGIFFKLLFNQALRIGIEAVLSLRESQLYRPKGFAMGYPAPPGARICGEDIPCFNPA